MINNAQEEKYIGLFLYNFTKFFEWPEEMKSGDFIIEVIGHKSVADELQQIAIGKTIGNQKLVIKNYTSVSEIGDCQILFLGYWQSRYLPEVLEKVKGRSTLLVSEMEGLLKKGTDINFIIHEGKIKFELQTGTITNKSIKINQRIRELAHRVFD